MLISLVAATVLASSGTSLVISYPPRFLEDRRTGTSTPSGIATSSNRYFDRPAPPRPEWHEASSTPPRPGMMYGDMRQATGTEMRSATGTEMREKHMASSTRPELPFGFFKRIFSFFGTTTPSGEQIDVMYGTDGATSTASTTRMTPPPGFFKRLFFFFGGN